MNLSPNPALTQIERASALLAAPTQRETSPWASLAAAAFAAVAAVLMAGIVVLGPGITLEDRLVEDAGFLAD